MRRTADDTRHPRGVVKWRRAPGNTWVVEGPVGELEEALATGLPIPVWSRSGQVSDVRIEYMAKPFYSPVDNEYRAVAHPVGTTSRSHGTVQLPKVSAEAGRRTMRSKRKRSRRGINK